MTKKYHLYEVEYESEDGEEKILRITKIREYKDKKDAYRDASEQKRNSPNNSSYEVKEAA